MLPSQCTLPIYFSGLSLSFFFFLITDFLLSCQLFYFPKHDMYQILHIHVMRMRLQGQRELSSCIEMGVEVSDDLPWPNPKPPSSTIRANNTLLVATFFHSTLYLEHPILFLRSVSHVNCLICPDPQGETVSHVSVFLTTCRKRFF